MRTSLLFLFMLVFAGSFSFAQTESPVQQYINKYKELAIAEEIRTGVPASITLAQGILESAAGRSDLSLSSNNHFGIKCKTEWQGATVYHDDDIKNECFRSYNSVEESYRDHSDFLRTRPHYGFLFDLEVTDYEGWCKGLKKAGYATNPAYPQLLMKVINENNLQQYTLLAIERVSNWSENIAVATQSEDLKPKTVSNGDSIDPLLTEVAFNEGPAEQQSKYPEGIFKHNQLKCLYLPAGTSLFAIARKHNLAFAKLLEYNDLDRNDDILKEDKIIYLERKSKKSNSKEHHIVLQGETIESISQAEGVLVESLLEYNKIQKGLQPQVGEKVYLQPGSPSYYPRLTKIAAR